MPLNLDTAFVGLRLQCPFSVYFTDAAISGMLCGQLSIKSVR